MKTSLIYVLAFLLGGIFLLTSTGCENMGLVKGTVTFSGKPCAQGTDMVVPPCSGPYPNYIVEVFKKGDLSKPVATSTTGAQGEFMLPLEQGDYVIFSQNGIDPESKKETPFTVVKGAEVAVSVTVSTGIQ